MSGTATIPWQDLRTDETRSVEDVLRAARFPRVDAYRYNAASIRVRVVDARFEGLRDEQRLALAEPPLEQLPERTQADILSLFVFAPSELVEPTRNIRKFAQNVEFEDYTPSMLVIRSRAAALTSSPRSARASRRRGTVGRRRRRGTGGSRRPVR